MTSTDVGRYSQQKTYRALTAAGYRDPDGGPCRVVPKARWHGQGAADTFAVHTRPLVVEWARRLAVQTKTAPLSGVPPMPKLGPAEWNALVALAASLGFTPVLSVVRRHAGQVGTRGGARPSVVELYRLHGPKDGSTRRSPMTRFYLDEVAR